jgi:formylglycine-generating enzyme required for sulfatase activity
MRGGDGFRYRLPAEAEWEYAARPGWKDDLTSDQELRARYRDGILDGPSTVGKLQPNVWGLFDVLGNAWEFTADWFGPGYYANSPRDDPKGPENGACKVLRGGSHMTASMMVNVTYRICGKPGERAEDWGFRLARELGR